jgi:catechol 2,3-dioxygenase-like lactoylglutathione lyase family enzyme
MLNHISIGVKDLNRAQTFYDAALEPLGYTCLSADDGSLGYGVKSVALWILKSAKPVSPDPNSGLHLCLDAPTRNAVAAFHTAALKNGGKDNGQPGIRGDYGPNYYAAFVLDPDGYRIEAYCGKPA